MGDNQHKIGWFSAAAIVIANMIGAGGFTSLGFQVQHISNTWVIIGLWLAGGIMALFGAFSYAELGASLQQSGGEYRFLSQLYHPFLGYLSGWISLTVGFAAAVALSAMAMGAYLAPIFGGGSHSIAIVAILILTFAHSFSIRQSSKLHNTLTIIKLILISGFVFSGWYFAPSSPDWANGTQAPVNLSPGILVMALLFVNYAYSGWNAAAYIVEEIDEPQKNLPRALIGGTVLVTVLYLLLQLAFLRQVPIAQMAGKVEVGLMAATALFGAQGSRWFSMAIALMIASGLSAMIWVGPRILRAMAADYRIWGFFKKDNSAGIPVRALWLHAAISMGLILTGTFEQVMIYSGFILQLFSTLAVGGVIILRAKKMGNAGYQSPGFPFFQLIYVVVSLWMLGYLLVDCPYESFLGLLNLLVGAVFYGVNGWLEKNRKTRLSHFPFKF
jgi:APA family basic amino acid/polyamine antiporter